jgi:hypothetical protein
MLLLTARHSWFIDLGLQIPLIENLASHIGTYDTLNLTDNALISLGNIPLGQSSQSFYSTDHILILLSLQIMNSVMLYHTTNPIHRVLAAINSSAYKSDSRRLEQHLFDSAQLGHIGECTRRGVKDRIAGMSHWWASERLP